MDAALSEALTPVLRDLEQSGALRPDIRDEGRADSAERAVEALWQAGRPATWPECPEHPDAHPLTATLRDRRAAWTCPRTGHLISGIGHLPAASTCSIPGPDPGPEEAARSPAPADRAACRRHRGGHRGIEVVRRDRPVGGRCRPGASGRARSGPRPGGGVHVPARLRPGQPRRARPRPRRLAAHQGGAGRRPAGGRDRRQDRPRREEQGDALDTQHDTAKTIRVRGACCAFPPTRGAG